VIEVVGDSSRDGEMALVRLVVDGDRIVHADSEGLERPLAGLTLLEAAAVPGETLTADAQANAIGEVCRAEREPGRVGVGWAAGASSRPIAPLRARSRRAGSRSVPAAPG
jgi:hypothetical protein